MIIETVNHCLDCKYDKWSVSDTCLMFLSLSLTSVILFLFPESNRRITGGAMQLSFTQLTIDYYPYHKAGMLNNFFNRCKCCFKVI